MPDGVPPRPWTRLTQVHGARVVTVTRPGEHAGAEADAAVTAVPGCALLVRTADFERQARLPDFAARGRIWAESGRHTALMKQLAGARGDAGRRELLEQHRIWGRLAEAAVPTKCW